MLMYFILVLLTEEILVSIISYELLLFVCMKAITIYVFDVNFISC